MSNKFNFLKKKISPRDKITTGQPITHFSFFKKKKWCPLECSLLVCVYIVLHLW